MARRGGGRHARNVRRFTPRRWLPFVALIGLIAAAVVVSEQVDSPDDREVRVSSPQVLLPVAALPDALSATWFCGGGSAADLSVVVANVGDAGAEAVVTFYSSDAGDEGGPTAERVTVPVNGRVRVRAGDVVSEGWVASTVEVFGGRATVERRVEGEDGFDQAPCASAAATTWHLPSGSTLRGATEHLFLFNPFPDTTAVDISFATDEGALAPQDLTGLAIPPRSLRVVTIENPARRREVAATVTTRTGRIVVDRLQVFDGSGDPVEGSGATPLTTDPPRGISSSPAIATPSARWFWPDARIIQGGRTQLAILNPSEDDAALELHVGFAQPDLYLPIAPIRISVPAGRQTVVDLTDDAEFLVGMELTLDLVSTEGVPVAAELVWHTPDRDLQELVVEDEPDGVQEGGSETSPEGEPSSAETSPEGEEGEAVDGADGSDGDGEEGDGEEEHDHADLGEGEGFTIYAPGVAITAGSPVAARSWFVAGTGASSTVASQIVVANPSARDVDVTVTELSAGAMTENPGAAVTVPAGGRATLDLSTFADRTSAFVVGGSGPLVVSRLLWALEGRGVSVDIATPFPDQVVRLPAR